MRIAYVINSVEGGGAAAPVPAIGAVLRAAGAEVRVLALTGRDRRGLPAMQASGLDVRVRDGAERDHRRAFGWLKAELWAWDADVVWTSLTRATLLGQRAGDALGLPVVSWQHAAYLKPLNRMLLRWRRDSTALWLADSECVAGLTRARLGVPPERLVTWPLFAADPAAPTARPWKEGDILRIGSLGRLHPVKGYDVLIDALALLRTSSVQSRTRFEIVIAGEGGERSALAERIARTGLTNVTLAGFAPAPRDFLAGLHLYVQPSRSEGLCIAAHEAMQAGLPVIASHVGEMPFSIAHRQGGLVVPPGDAEALAFALAEYLAAPSALHDIGRYARGRILSTLGRDRFEDTGRSVVDRISVLLAGTSEPHRSTTHGRNGRSAWHRSASPGRIR